MILPAPPAVWADAKASSIEKQTSVRTATETKAATRAAITIAVAAAPSNNTMQYNKFKVKNANGCAVTLRSTGGKMKKTSEFLV